MGGFYPPELYRNEIAGIKQGQQLAAVNFEESLLDGIFYSTLKIPHFISAPYFPSFPKDSKFLFIKGRSSFTKKYIFIGISYLNIPILKNFWKFSILKKTLNKNILKTSPEIVICNTLNLAQLAAVACSTTKNKCIKSVIIMDLPIFPGDCSIGYQFYLRYIEWPLVKFALRKFDYFIVATRNISNLLNLPSNRISVLDGIYSSKKYGPKELKLNLKKKPKEQFPTNTIMYSGSLDQRYGVKSLVDSFRQETSISANLIICGSGPLRKYIENSANEDSRIRYLGLMDVESLRQLQASVDLLVNPRDNFGDYNLYSFPSKTLEYMASGTPVLMNKLSCMSSDYDDLIYYRDTNETFLEAIKRVLCIPINERTNRAYSAQKFVLSSKTSSKQVDRILSELKNKFINLSC